MENEKEIMRISDVIEKLKEIKEEHGDLPCYSVDYHSDFYDVPLLRDPTQINPFPDLEFKQFKINFHSSKPYLLIYGGSR